MMIRKFTLGLAMLTAAGYVCAAPPQGAAPFRTTQEAVRYYESLVSRLAQQVRSMQDENALLSASNADLKQRVTRLESDTRALAEEHRLPNAQKHESQDICFVPTGKYTDFIEEYTGKTYPEGNFVDVRNGQVLGTHKGIIRYTVGQRRGLGLALPQSMYVTKVAPEENTVYLGLNEDLFSRELIADDVNWIAYPGFDSESDEPLSVTAKVRYNQKDSPATVYPAEGGRIRVVFDEPQRAITRGQAVVLYDGETVVGGGTIDEVI